MTRRGRIDKTAVAADYRAGIKSNRIIAEDHGVSEAYVRKLAREGGWERDLAGQVRARAAEKVARTEALASCATDIDEINIIEVNAEAMAQVELTQRQDIKRLRNIVSKLMDMIEPQLEHPEEFRALGKLMAQEGDSSSVDRLNELYRKVIALPTTVDMAGRLAQTLKILIELERKVLKMDSDGANQASTVDDLLRRIGKGA
jgi:hypothetical protein